MIQPDGGIRRDALIAQLLHELMSILGTGHGNRHMDEKKPNNAGAYYRKCENYTRIIKSMQGILPRPSVVTRVFAGKAGLRHLDYAYPEAVTASGRALRTFPDRRYLLKRISGLAAAAADHAHAAGTYHTAAARYTAALQLTSLRTITRRTSSMVNRLRRADSEKHD